MLIDITERAGTEAPANHPLTEAQAAVRLGLKVPTLRAWRHQGRGPAYVRLGRAVRYLAADLEEFLASNRHTPQPPATAESRNKRRGAR